MVQVIRFSSWIEADSFQKRILDWIRTNQNAFGNAWAHPRFAEGAQPFAIVVDASISKALSADELRSIEEVSRDEYRQWTEILEDNSTAESHISPFEAVIVETSKRFARLIAKDPSFLDRLEWRDLERLIANICEELGFDAELGPGSGDGGKDVVLSFRDADGARKTYLVEVKHWKGRKVGAPTVDLFIRVVHRSKASGGIFVSTSGFCETVLEVETRATSTTLHLAGANSVVAICDTFVRKEAGLWHRPINLVDVVTVGAKKRSI